MRLKEGVEGLHLCYYVLLLYFFSQLLLEGTGSFMSGVRFRPAGFCQILGGQTQNCKHVFKKHPRDCSHQSYPIQIYIYYSVNISNIHIFYLNVFFPAIISRCLSWCRSVGQSVWVT